MSSIENQIKERVSKIIYDRGIACYRKNIGTVTTLLADGNYITVEAEFKEKENIIKTAVTMTQDKGEYVEGGCTCVDFKNRKKICKHMVALGKISDKTKDVLEIIGTEEMVMKFDEDFEAIKDDEKSKISEKSKKNLDKKKLEKAQKTKEEKLDKKVSQINQVKNIEEESTTKNNENQNKNITKNEREKINNTEKLEFENDSKILKEELSLELEIDEESYSDYRYGYDYDRTDFVPGYVLRLKIGNKKTYYIKDVIKFVNSVMKNERCSITSKFFYEPELYTFSEVDKEIIRTINEFCEEISKTDTVIRNKKGLKLVNNFLDKILDHLDFSKKIYMGENIYKKSQEYEPLFIKDKDEIKFRKIEQLQNDSFYFTFKNDDINIFKMEKKERDYFNKIGIDREYLNELLNDNKNSKFREEFLSENINIAKYINKLGNVELIVQEWNHNLLNIRVSDSVRVIKENNKYYIPRPNKKLIETLQTILDRVSISDLSISEHDKSYIIDYDGLGIISEIIDEKYSDKVVIQLDNNIKKAKNINVNFTIKKLNNELLDFTFDVSGVSEKDVDLIIESIKNEKVYVTLSSGELVKIANKTLEELLGVVDSISNLKLGSNKISKIKALQLAQISKNIQNDLNEIREFKKLFHKIKEKKEITPKNIKVELFPYQKLGFNWLKNMYDIGFGAILADDMGLGKTLQTISTLEALCNENKNFFGIIIVPTSLLHNWKEEILKFSNINPILIEGTSKKRKEMIKQNKNGIFITTYQSLRNDIDEYKDKKFDLIVLDEAQNIKTTTSQIKKAVMKLNSKVNFALTGTPVENNILELWSIFDFILPGYLDSLVKFKKNYKEVLVNPNSKKIENLRKIISPFILRRTKKEVLTELPEKFETDLVVYLSDEQKQLYLSYVKKAKKEISKFNKKENNRMKILAILTKLRQICNSPTLFKEDYAGEVAKIEVLKDLLPDITENDHRLLIFSQFVGTLKEIEKELLNQGIKYFYIDGSVKSSERLEICKRFNNGERDVVLISLKAGGTGLNLTGADVVIHYDPWWNIAVENQASDRAYRIGQQNSVQVIKLITTGTIEEKIIKIQENKKILSENLLEGHEGDKILFDMSDEELMNLLS